MPRRRADGWRGPSRQGEFPTLGYEVADWIEAHCVIPDGPNMGQPFVLTDEQLRFLLWHYRLKPDARPDPGKPSAAFVYRRSMLVRPQKWGKGPLSAGWICAEAEGPVLFDGWDAAGEPVGKPWSTPWIQVAAASENQTANVWRALLPMIVEGPLIDVMPDVGETRINLRGGGFIEPVTASGRSRLGQRLTAALHDEPHSWLEANGGWRLADTQRRNLAGMGGRSIATTNGWDPAENSDAQRTFEARLADIFIDYPTPPPGSVRNKRERRKVLRAVYGDSHWVDIDRIDADIEELLAKGDAQQAERFFLNRIVATSDAFLEDAATFDALAHPRDLPAGTRVVLGFDGSQYDDWTAIRARAFIDGQVYGFTPTFADGAPTIWNPADFGGEVPRGEVQAAVEELFGRYDVARLYCDPELWQSEIDAWSARWPKRVVSWATYRTRQMADALERWKTDVTTGAFTHDGCAITATHVRNARRVRRASSVVVGKPTPHQKIDAMVADVIAHEAANDVIAAGQDKSRPRGMVVM